MRKKVNILSGISNNVCVLTATSNGKDTFQFKPFCYKEKSEKEILLKSLISILHNFKNMEIIFYSNNDQVSFEWEKEYKVEKHFSPNIKNLNEWNKIVEIVKKNNIELTIRGEDGVTSVLNKMINKRW